MVKGLNCVGGHTGAQNNKKSKGRPCNLPHTSSQQGVTVIHSKRLMWSQWNNTWNVCGSL